MYVLVLVLAFSSFMVALLFGRVLGRTGTGVLTTGLIGMSFLTSAYAFYDLGLQGGVCSYKLFDWFVTGTLITSWGFLFDSVTVTMLIVVTFISFLVHLYSMEYMGTDPHYVRFTAYLSLFTFFMLCLVTADNLTQTFLGWEGVGVSSYLLINFWFTRLEANTSAIKAVVVNRFGDLGLGLCIFLTYACCKSVNYGVIFGMLPAFEAAFYTYYGIEFDVLFWICMFLLVGVVGKSAQVGLHTWLPDAMEGPTPVSALIHAATMVTAGVFVLVRCAPILEACPEALGVVTVFGALTAFIAGTIGTAQFDLKRVIAYSTCSQLGYMVLACGLSAYNVAMFHLLTHACFKALLFLSAGAVIHGLAGEQDIRKMGGLGNLLPLSYMMFVVGNLGLLAFPYLSGFYSKDLIIEISTQPGSVGSSFWSLAATVSAVLTTFYSLRLLFVTFYGNPLGGRKLYEGVHDAPILMAIPLLLLALCTIFIGYIFSDLFTGLGSPAILRNCILSLEPGILNVEFDEDESKLLPFELAILVTLVAFLWYVDNKKFGIRTYESDFEFFGVSAFFNAIYDATSSNVLFLKRWYFDNLHNYYLVYDGFWLCHTVCVRAIDRGIIEIFGPTGLVRGVMRWNSIVVSLQSGFLYHYVFVMVVGILFLGLAGILSVFLSFTELYIILSMSLIMIEGDAAEKRIVSDK